MYFKGRKKGLLRIDGKLNFRITVDKAIIYFLIGL
jgi:hypothetical protein